MPCTQQMLNKCTPFPSLWVGPALPGVAGPRHRAQVLQGPGGGCGVWGGGRGVGSQPPPAGGCLVLKGGPGGDSTGLGRENSNQVVAPATWLGSPRGRQLRRLHAPAPWPWRGSAFLPQAMGVPGCSAERRSRGSSRGAVLTALLCPDVLWGLRPISPLETSVSPAGGSELAPAVQLGLSLRMWVNSLGTVHPESREEAWTLPWFVPNPRNSRKPAALGGPLGFLGGQCVRDGVSGTPQGFT